MNIPDFLPLSFAQCGHLNFQEMTDEEIKAKARVFDASIVFHGKVQLFVCHRCAERMLNNMEKFSIGTDK